MSSPVASVQLRAVSWVVWRLVPGRAATKMAEFSHVEAGSGIDGLAAVEETSRTEMRALYFHHALDELKHARMFRERAIELSQARGRAQAVVEDASYIASHGIRGEQSLFQELGELEFLAFVWVAESRAAEQFEVYGELLHDNENCRVMFEEIAKDERFHISYALQELERYRREGRGAEVDAAVRRVRLRRWWEAWLRLTHDLGAFMAGLWLSILYFVVIGPFSLIARVSERRTEGWVAVAARPPAAERAKGMA